MRRCKMNKFLSSFKSSLPCPYFSCPFSHRRYRFFWLIICKKFEDRFTETSQQAWAPPHQQGTQLPWDQNPLQNSKLHLSATPSKAPPKTWTQKSPNPVPAMRQSHQNSPFQLFWLSSGQSCYACLSSLSIEQLSLRYTTLYFGSSSCLDCTLPRLTYTGYSPNHQ